MRIRKLATELEVDERALVDLLARLGHPRYTDPQQQLPAEVEALVRRHAASLPSAVVEKASALPRPRAAARDSDVDLFERAMADVRRLDVRPPAPPRPAPPRAPPPRPASAAPPAGPAARPASSGASPARPLPPPAPSSGIAAHPAPPPRSPAPVPSAAAPARSARPLASPAPSITVLAERNATEGKLAVAIAERDAAQERIAALERDLAAARDQASALEARLHEVDTHRRQLQRERDALSSPPASIAMRTCFERRGLIGEDEIAQAIRALLDAHRTGALVAVRLADPAELEDLLWERVLLLAEGEAVPPGTVAVRVPPDRSEGHQSSANRAAMSRFSTACLVRNLKRIVIVGGSPAYRRTLKAGLDPRLDVRLLPGDRRGRLPDVTGADLVLLWASTILDHSVSAHFPHGKVIPHRSISRMLDAATEWIEAGHPDAPAPG